MKKPVPFVRPNRDFVTTIREDGSRLFLHPADTRGRFTSARRWSGWLLIAIYLLLPWIPIGGHPAVFLDIADRRFHLFGFTLAFQDTWLMFFGITGLGFGLFFITALLGRVWCGWACPQTVFLEHVYRRVERWLEGDAVARRQLDAQPWTPLKFVRRGGKQVIFFVLSAVIAHLFLAYYVSIPELWAMMSEAPGTHWAAFVFVFIFTGILYFNFSWFREQLCIVICPYGRLQSALIDDHSLVIGYDNTRGEPRAKLNAGQSPETTASAGACIDCNRCVQVCPTGIDIRQGLQLECIGCAACVDACDEVMDKVKRPRGLVRYDSLTAFAGGRTRWLRPRTLVYAVLMLVGMSVATWAVSTVRPANLAITRLTGAPYFVTEDAVRNQFLVRIVNKTDHVARFVVTLPDAPDALLRTGLDDGVELAPLAEDVRSLVVQMPRNHYEGEFALTVRLADEAGTFSLERVVRFVGPDKELLEEDAHEKKESH
ncbi:MAG: cytochrome c oxidase accessory protein CcoG [Opitutaceae bacterium]|jgi:cytochrome c oxidase accessory protein FixG